MIDENSVIAQLEQNLMSFGTDPKVQNVGTVERNTDGVITVSGLSQATMGERVVFDDGTEGLVLNLDEDYASIILLGEGSQIKEGSQVKRTGEMLSINVSDELLGRVVGPTGVPADGKANIKKGKLMPLEKIAPGVVARQPVDTPLKTGIKAIDAMFPIGRGQRELIIGDRGLGKTAVAIDTIINQKNFRDKGSKLRPVICVYVAIGQKKSTIAQVIGKLTEHGAMEYSIVVSASASDPAALQYLAPYAGILPGKRTRCSDCL
jgi:F-type H+/Na+-transporting ATPase subunit alpha